MHVLETMRLEISELVRLVRESERYCTSIAQRPNLASDSSHKKELAREHRINELSARYGVTA
jgi:hypothetical protein